MKRKTACREVKASLTVEAALVMSIVLLSLTSFLIFAFRAQDQFSAKSALYLSMELFCYRDKNGTGAEEYKTAGESTSGYIGGDRPKLKIREGVAGVYTKGTMTLGDNTYEMVAVHPDVPFFMRTATLTDLISNNKEEETDENKGNTESRGENADR